MSVFERLLSFFKPQPSSHKAFVSKFESISIRGRFIYGYLCLLNLIKYDGFEPIPEELEQIMAEFVWSNSLDVWHGKAADIQPSFVMYDNRAPCYLTNEAVQVIVTYYERQPEPVIGVIESLINLGIANLYGAYKSSSTMPYLESIINLLERRGVELPDFSKIEHCISVQAGGWGEKDNLLDYIS